MTVAEIKEYIDEQTKILKEQQYADKVIIISALIQAFSDVNRMLDELPRDYAQETINDMEKVLDNAWKKILGSDNK